MIVKKNKPDFLFIIFLCCDFFFVNELDAVFCSNVMRENFENCQSLVCNDQLADDFLVQREIVGKDGENCKYRELYKKYNFSLECNLTNHDVRGVLADFSQYGGPWLMDYESSCQPIFGPLVFKKDQKNNLLQRAVEQNMQNLYDKNDWKYLRILHLNFLSLPREIREKRDFLYWYSADDFAMRDTVKNNLEKKLQKLEFFIGTIFSNQQSKIIENYSHIIENHISFIKYLYNSIITLSSVMYINNNYKIVLNDMHLDYYNREYNDFVIKNFDRDAIEIAWNIKYFERIFSLYKNDFYPIDESNVMHHNKHREQIKIDLEDRIIYIKLRANQTFDPLQMRIINGIPRYKIVKKKFAMKDFVENYENNIGGDFLTTLIKEINFDIYDLDSGKSFIKDIIVKRALKE